MGRFYEPKILHHHTGLTSSAPPSISEIAEKIDEIAIGMKDDTVDSLASELYVRNKKLDISTINKMAREVVECAWKTPEGRLSIVSGKGMLASLSTWSKDQFGVSFSAIRIARTLQRHEIAEELTLVIRAIERGEPFEE